MESFEHHFEGSSFRKMSEDYYKNIGRIPYRRARPDRLKPRTETQKINAHIHETVLDFLTPLKKFIEVGYRNEPGVPFAEAIQYIYEVALYRDGYDSAVDPYGMQISFGKLVYQDEFKMHFDADTSEVVVEWDPALPEPKAKEKAASENDWLMIVAYDAWGAGEAYGKIYGARRNAGVERLKVPVYYPTSYFVYVCFLSADDTDQSTSCCLGALQVGE
jgi:hypothetical protein